MAIMLKQSTEVIIPVGPFMDASDAVTPETGVDLGDADQAELLGPAGAATVDLSSNTWEAITGSDGWYHLTLTAAQLATCGQYRLVVQDADVCLGVHVPILVVEGPVYDFFFTERPFQSYL